MLAIELWCCCNQQGKPNALKWVLWFWSSDDYVKT